MISVVLVEDHQIVRESIRHMLEQQDDIQVVDETANGREAVKIASTLEPDVLLVDLTIPELHGLGVIYQVTYQTPQTRIVVLSMHNRKLYVIAAVTNGADGYILKDDPFECILEAIHLAPNDRPYLSPHVSMTKEQLCERMESGGSQSTPQHVLTAREKEVLSYIGAGYTTTQVAEKLSLSPRTVEVHSRNIRNKLDLENLNQMVRWAMERGLVPGEEL